MNVFGIDPGITTGVALLNLSRQGIASIEFIADVPCNLIESVLLEVLRDHYPHLIGVEQIPIPTEGKMNQQLLEIMTITSQVVKEANPAVSLSFGPGAWKNSFIGRLPLSRFVEFAPIEKMSPHQMDAVRIGLFASFKEGLLHV